MTAYPISRAKNVVGLMGAKKKLLMYLIDYLTMNHKENAHRRSETRTKDMPSQGVGYSLDSQRGQETVAGEAMYEFMSRSR